VPANDREESLTAAELGVILLGAMLIVVLAAVLYERHREPINEAWLWLIRLQVLAFTWLEGSEARALFQWARTAAPAQLQLKDMMAATAAAGRWMRWINLLMLTPLALFIWYYADRSRSLRKRFNARELLARNQHLFPCIAPALRRNLLAEPWHRGTWAVAYSPTRWVADHGLLLDREGKPVPRELLITAEGLPNEDSPLQQRERLGAHPGTGFQLDRPRAQHLFAAQLGEPFVSLERLPPHRRALAAAFLAFAHAKREEGQRLLDQLSRSFREAPRPGAPFQLELTGADDLVRRCPITPALQLRLQRHSYYVTTWFVALLECARERGLLPTAEFLWLRPADRTLWYALNQVGGGTRWTEAAGIWAHYEAETVLSSPLREPEVAAAVDALEHSLIFNGWLPEQDEAASDAQAPLL
jgi:intracellular multiplication protein IcmP